ncbi:MAG: hypothetical protein ACRENP_07100 [Longimicrobiales bacterium]
MTGLSVAYFMLGLLWVALSLGGGALLAVLGRRVHPALSFGKLWVFYSGLLGLGAAALFAIGIL